MAESSAPATAESLKIAILVARFNQIVTERLQDGAQKAFQQAGESPSQLDVIHTPGAFELPQLAAQLARSGKHHALVALGAVIQGETTHFEYLSSSTIQGLMQISLQYHLPIGLGVLTVKSLAQALERTQADNSNKGHEAMRSALEMSQLLRSLKSPD